MLLQARALPRVTTAEPRKSFSALCACGTPAGKNRASDMRAHRKDFGVKILAPLAFPASRRREAQSFLRQSARFRSRLGKPDIFPRRLVWCLAGVSFGVSRKREAGQGLNVHCL